MVHHRNAISDQNGAHHSPMEFMRSTQLQKPVESYSVSDEQSIQSICARERPDINDRDSLYFVLQSIAVIKMQTMTIKHSRETNKGTTADEHRQVPAMDVRVTRYPHLLLKEVRGLTSHRHWKPWKSLVEDPSRKVKKLR